MKMIVLVCVLTFALPCFAQTNRHGTSNGTVTELPSPVRDDQSPKLVETDQLRKLSLADPHLARIESEWNDKITALDAQLNPRERSNFKELSGQISALKHKREVAILNRLKEIALEQHDTASIMEINRALAQQYSLLEASETQSSKRTQRPNVAPTQKQQTGNGSASGGAQ